MMHKFTTHKPIVLFFSIISVSGISIRGNDPGGWFYFEEFPLIWSHSKESWHYVALTDNKLWIYDYGNSDWSLLQSGLITQNDFEKGFLQKVDLMQTNPTDYGLFTETENETNKSLAFESGYTEGFNSLNPQPINGGNAPTFLSGMELISIGNSGLITKFTYSQNGQSATSLQAGMEEYFDYLWEKTSEHAGTLTLNSTNTIIQGSLVFTSTNGGTFNFTYRDINTRAISNTSNGSFTIN